MLSMTKEQLIVRSRKIQEEIESCRKERDWHTDILLKAAQAPCNIKKCNHKIDKLEEELRELTNDLTKQVVMEFAGSVSVYVEVVKK